MATNALSTHRTRIHVGGQSATTDLRIAGTLVLMAGAGILMAIITAEALYPAAYSTGANAISDLGGTEPPDSVILQPSATIFDGAMMVVGVLVVVASWFVHQAYGRRSVSVPLLVLGASALGVGLFPGDTGTPHALFAMACFISGGVAAVCAALVVGSGFRWVSIALGAIALLTLGSYVVLGDGNPLMSLGIGGLERWIVYPIVIWLIAFGGHLLGVADTTAMAAGAGDQAEPR
jgi:hypothetical membrane protein